MEFLHDTSELTFNTTGIGYLFNSTKHDENGVGLGGMDDVFLPKTGVLDYPFTDSNHINSTVQRYSSHHRVQRFLRNIITPIICVLGFLGNIINIIVLSRLRLLRNDGARDSGTHLGLTVLAVSDMLFCLSMFPRCLVPESSSLFEKKDFYLFYQVCRFSLYFLNSVILSKICKDAKNVHCIYHNRYIFWDRNDCKFETIFRIVFWRLITSYRFRNVHFKLAFYTVPIIIRDNLKSIHYSHKTTNFIYRLPTARLR